MGILITIITKSTSLFFFDMYGVLICRTILLTYKHKAHSVDSDGRIISNADIDFFINNVCSFFSLCLSDIYTLVLLQRL